MSELAEAIGDVLRKHRRKVGDMGCICGYECFPHEQRPHVIAEIVALFTEETSTLPEYDVRIVSGGSGDMAYGSQIMHYKGLKTVRRWSFTDA